MKSVNNKNMPPLELLLWLAWQLHLPTMTSIHSRPEGNHFQCKSKNRCNSNDHSLTLHRKRPDQATHKRSRCSDANLCKYRNIRYYPYLIQGSCHGSTVVWVDEAQCPTQCSQTETMQMKATKFNAHGSTANQWTCFTNTWQLLLTCIN